MKTTEKQSFIKGIRGFTLIELSIVMLVSSLILVGMLNLYKVYTARAFLLEARQKQTTIDTAFSRYQARTSISGGALPCPADPSLPISDADSGVANCSLLTDFLSGTANFGDCRSGSGSGPGICLVAGHRDTDADPDNINDPVLIGTVPYKTLGLVMVDSNGDGVADTVSSGGVSDNVSVDLIFDPWGYKMSYAVSAYMTSASTYKNTIGALHIRTELGTDVTAPPGSAHYVLVSYGNNHAGAYTADGRIVIPCLVGAAESDNCNTDSVFIRGLRTLASGASYYDDTIKERSFSISKLWDFVTGTPDIYNLNTGYVGIGTLTPSERLQVVGNVKSISASQQQICDSGGASCWDPKNIASTAGTQCSAYYPPASSGNVWVVVGIQAGRVVCSEIPLIPVGASQTCTPGEYVVGFNAGGAIICSLP